MHEHSLMADLIRKVESIAHGNAAARVVCVRIKVGSLSGLSIEHLREHFLDSARGTLAEGATLEIATSTGVHPDYSLGIVLDSLEVLD